jgi:hypothetical protein
MGMKITQPLTETAVTPDLVNEWYYQAVGIEAPIDAQEFKDQGDIYGVNWLGVYVLALIDTCYFKSKHFREKNSLMGDTKTFFSSKEGVTALTQNVACYGGSNNAKKSCPYTIVLPSTLAVRNSSMFGSHWYFQELTQDPKHFERLYGTIQSYCLKNEQPDLPLSAGPIVPLEETKKILEEPLPTPTSHPKFQLIPLLRFALKTLWVLTLKFFPWLGWLSFVVYNLIDLLVK